ncbi:MAG: hypothetical protein J5585_10585 [Clostridia bacterium]|nr:hypothetical protein [Clostridia bacterium]
MDFKSIDKKYRPVPFWSWNEKLDTNETRRQIALMDDVGIGGFFMHARGGLQTEYMGDEWFDNVTASVDEAAARGMHAWAYDENGWPSGFGGGKVNGLGLRYQQKYLRMAKLEDKKEAEHEIYRDGRFIFYFDVNPFYVDTLDHDVIAEFIRVIYEPYYDRYKSTFDGFFTDEPQISRNGIPWSLTLPAEYEKEYGEPLLPHLYELFCDEDDYKQTRLRFWRLVTMLFSRNFMKQIHDWCVDHNLKFTGHMVLEERLDWQITSNGACMPHYEYFDIPGMDWLCRPIYPCLTIHQLASAAAQTGKKQILTESFALCGHNVSHEELKRNYEWMMVRGVNLLCQHLEGYSLRGIRKRDYPPAMHYQQPWWEYYKQWNDAVSRTGMLLCEGKLDVDTLVLHNISSAWVNFNCRDYQQIQFYNDEMLKTIDKLERKHVNFHLGDEIMLERHGRVEGKELVIGQMRYKKIVVPAHAVLFGNTEKLLCEFKENGGLILAPEEIAANEITDNEKITYTKRRFDGFTMHYFVNSHSSAQHAVINCGGKILEQETGELIPFYGEYDFAPMSSLIVIDDGTPAEEKPAKTEKTVIDLTGDWKITEKTPNSLTLDKCTYRFDGVLQQENGYILNVAQRAYELGRPVDVECEFSVFATYVPEKLMLGCETPEIFDITVNGKKVDKTDRGFFRDHAFRLLDISGLFVQGDNRIVLKTHFEQSPQVYENMKNAKVFESEKNKLTYDAEIEALYLVGDFSVGLNGTFENVPHDAYFFDGGFVIGKPAEKVGLHRLDLQGFPFFSGRLTLQKTVVSDGRPSVIRFDKRGVNAIHVKINGVDVKTLMFTPYEIDVTEWLKPGENVIELTVVNNLRNLLGPHHHQGGELYAVAPSSFFYEPCIWTDYREGPYTEKYCFVETSLI